MLGFRLRGYKGWEVVGPRSSVEGDELTTGLHT